MHSTRPHYAYLIAISFRVGYWPDVARSQPEYNRPTWHYELGPTLVFGDKSKLNVPDRPGELPTDATMETQELYVSQAIALCSKTLGDKTASPTGKALALCWIGHHVADVFTQIGGTGK